MEKTAPISSSSSSGTTPQGSTNSGAANLSNSVINLAGIRELARKQLLNILDSVRILNLNLFIIDLVGEREKSFSA